MLAIPDPLVISSSEVGSSAYMFAGGLGEAITKATGVKVRVIPTASDQARMEMLSTGKANMLVGAADQNIEGIEDYSNIMFGPLPFQVLYRSTSVGQTIYVRNDSNIKTFSDLKGKKVDWSTQGAGHFHMTALLAFGNLTWDDVDHSVALLTGDAKLAALRDGKVDAITYNVDASFMKELEQTPGGCRALPMPPEDKEGWARIQKVAPWLYPRLAQPSEGAGFGGKATWVFSKSYPDVAVLKGTPDDVGYFVTKTLYENYNLYKDYNPQCALTTPEGALDIVGKLIAPMHPGAVKYFKEIGKWTDAHERWNQAIINHDNALKAAWDLTLAEAKAKGIKDADYPALWLARKPPLIDIQGTLKAAGIQQ